MKEFKERFAELFAEQDSLTQIGIYNEYANANNYEPIWYMEEITDVCGKMDALSLAYKIFFGDFNPCHDFFTFDGRANLESILCVESWLEDYVSDMARWYEDRPRKLVDFIGIEAWDIYCEDGDEDETDSQE